MSGWTLVRIIFQALAMTLLMGSIGVTVFSVYSPAWQVVNITENFKYHEHGLWRDCETYTRKTDKKDSAPYCSYKFNMPSEEEYWETEKEKGHEGHDHHPLHGIGDVEEHQHLDLRYLRIVFGLAIAACVLGFVSFCVSLCAFCYKPCSIIWTILNLIATGCMAAALIIYFRYSHQRELREITGETLRKTYRLELGTAFWFAVGGCLGFLGATVLSLIAAVSHFIAERRTEQRQAKIIWPKGVTSSAV